MPDQTTAPPSVDRRSRPTRSRQPPAPPTRRRRQWLRSRAADGRRERPPLLGEAAVVLALVGVYDHIRDLAATRADLAFSNATRLLRWETVAGLDVERPLNAALAAHRTLQVGAAWYYQLAHLTVTLAVLLWCYCRRPEAYRGARNALLMVNAVGLVVFWLVPVAPPRLLPGAGFVDSGVVSGVAARATTVTPDLYAAMPSLHFAWATWVAVVVARATGPRPPYRARPSPRPLAWLRVRLPGRPVLAAAHTAVTAVVVIATGNHYILDLAAGGGLAVAAAWAADQQRTRRGLRLSLSPTTAGRRDRASRGSGARAAADGTPGARSRCAANASTARR